MEPSEQFKSLKRIIKIIGLSLDIAVISIIGLVVLLYSTTLRAGFDSPIADPEANSFWGGLHEGIQLMFCIGAVLGIYAILRLTLHSALLTEWLASKAREDEKRRFLLYILTALPTIILWLFAFWGSLIPLWGFIALTSATILCIAFSSWGIEFEEESPKTPAMMARPEVARTTAPQRLRASGVDDLSSVLAKIKHARLQRSQEEDSPNEGE